MYFGFISLFIASHHMILLFLESPDIGLPNYKNFIFCKLPDLQTASLDIWTIFASFQSFIASSSLHGWTPDWSHMSKFWTTQPPSNTLNVFVKIQHTGEQKIVAMTRALFTCQSIVFSCFRTFIPFRS